MSEWVDVIPAAALAEGEQVLVEVDGVDVAVFNIDGEYCAVQDICTHDGAEISSGRREDAVIICPRHGARFCLKTGKVLKGPAYEGLPRFAVRVENGLLQVSDTPV